MATAKDTIPEITAITVAGFKSLARETRIEIAPLTLLAGANSSGKSSVMQPLLLLKQTLEATYDPGPLLLSDSHVRFTDASQLLARRGRSQAVSFQVGIEVEESSIFESFSKSKVGDFTLDSMITRMGSNRVELRTEMTDEQIRQVLDVVPGSTIVRDRCFLRIQLPERDQGSQSREALLELLTAVFTSNDANATLSTFDRAFRSIIHLPGLRGRPQRAYPVAAVGDRFVGPFPVYTASVVLDWQERGDIRLKTLSSQLGKLGLTWKVEARRVDATSIELRVGRLPALKRGGASDLVNIADVGIGVSQTLPVLVALLAARPGQLVYLEQPEIHLHPAAQQAMAAIFCDAARRGVKVVAETHSDILLLAVQTLVSEGAMSPDLVKLHWFERGEDGTTTVTSADLDEAGAYGSWPEDFGRVRAEGENRYLTAAESHMFRDAPRGRKAKTARR